MIGGGGVRWLLVGLVMMLAVSPAMAKDFSMNGTEFAAAFVANTISNLDLASQFLDVLYAANATDTDHNLFQNLWGIVYGGVLTAGWNNQITAIVLDELADTSNTNLTDARTNISLAIAYLATNTTTVFGDTAGSAGMSYLLKKQVEALENRSITYNSVPLIEAYARATANTIYENVLFMTELFKVLPKALT